MTERTFRCTEIDWDVDEGAEPPATTTMDISIQTDDTDIEEMVSDALSEESGFCHNGFAMVDISHGSVGHSLDEALTVATAACVNQPQRDELFAALDTILNFAVMGGLKDPAKGEIEDYMVNHLSDDS